MIEQLTRYYVPLKDDMSKFEELCERKKLKKRDIAIIFEHLDINYKTQTDVLKAREIQKPLVVEQKKKQKPKRKSVDTLMWVSIISSAISMVSAVMVLLVLLLG